MATAGRVAIVPKGEYDITATYKRLDMVRYEGNVYVAKEDNTGVLPTNKEIWMLSVEGLGSSEDEYVKKTDFATVENPGIVKPDGKTIKIEEDGKIVGASSGFTGTQEEFEQALENGEIEAGTIVNITDDYQEGGITVDDALSETSKNPVQNKVITIILKDIYSLFPDGAASHNAVFRQKDLTSLGIDEICAPIADGTFKDRFPGDYFDITINAEGEEVVRCVFSGFNTYLHNGDISFETNHAVITTKNCLKTTHAMNPTNTTAGGFVGSDMWTNVIPMYNTAFGSVLGSHLLSHRTLLTKDMNAELASNAGAGFKGASSSWDWYDTKLSLLSEIQVYGSNVFSSSFHDTGCDNLQLPLFVLDPTAKVCGRGGNGEGTERTRMYYFLKNVASASDFALVDSYGGAYHFGAISNSGVRPIFCIG